MCMAISCSWSASSFPSYGAELDWNLFFNSFLDLFLFNYFESLCDTETDTADMPVMPFCFWVLVVAKSSLNIYDSLLPEPLRSRSSSNMAPSSPPFICFDGFAGDDEASTRSSLPLSWEPDFPPKGTIYSSMPRDGPDGYSSLMSFEFLLSSSSTNESISFMSEFLPFLFPAP